jgi:hypothetical protein
MDLLQTVDWSGKEYLVYIDAEFQTFRLPEVADGGLDALEFAGFEKTPYLYGMKPTNFGQNNYHFLLNFGYVCIDRRGTTRYNLALMPSLFNVDSPLFNNGQLLEPGYTTCAPATDAAIKKLRWASEDLFPFYKTLTIGQRVAFREINSVYNGSINEVECMKSLITLNHFFSMIVPRAVLVHKGRNDLHALRNSAHLYGLPLGPMVTRDLDTFKFRLPGLESRRLGLVQEYFVEPTASTAAAAPAAAPATAPASESPSALHKRLISLKPKLGQMRDHMLLDVRHYFIELWGPEAAEASAHNPLVDCVYAATMDVGLA